MLSQKVADMEVVLVDDGSPDRSPAMCDEWAARDKRVTVVHKANGGLSSARNAGMKKARGEYVTFVDSDDWVLEGTYSGIMEWWREHGDVDMIEFPVEQETEARVRLDIHDETFASAKDYWERTMAWNHTYACNKIYRKWLFGSVQYPVGRLFEDVQTLPLLLAQSPKVATLKRGGYHYTWNEKSISADVAEDARALRHHLEALLLAKEIMQTRLLAPNGWNLYRAIMCRQIDLYKVTGEMLLHCPGARLICVLHKMIRR